jgi:hypothetical protein
MIKQSFLAFGILAFCSGPVVAQRTVWPAFTGDGPVLDTTLRVTVPSSGIEYLRRHVMLAFETGVGDSTKVAFFNAHRLVVLAATVAGVFYLRTEDPGERYDQYDSMVRNLRASADVSAVAPLLYTQLALSLPVVFPDTTPPWPILTYQTPALDAGSLVTVPNSKAIYFRRDLLVVFEDSVMFEQRRAFFHQHGLIVLGVTPFGRYYVRTPDPGPTYREYEAFRARLDSVPGTRFVNELFFDGITPTTYGPSLRERP